MGTGPRNPSLSQRQGISIISCTNRPSYVKNLVQNYVRQAHPKKELIIVVNSNDTSLSPYYRLTQKLRNVRIFRIPEHETLGACLNFAVNKASYPYIAKFDDDDYYAPYYLAEMLQTLKRKNADIIGKRAHFMYLRGSKMLLLRFPQDENREVTYLPGATLVFKRSVFKRIQFPNRNIGEDDLFCLSGKMEGYKVYSAGKYNFVAIRRKNSANHTWIISDKELLSHHKKIPHVRNYKRFVSRKPKGFRS
ncbi:glycosyltransferase [Risungbinella massiliensis]|uniref:glycosyltransferase n=1 Tax=Risungbinella massiliensis TaxID=1329796 RepID=UPI0005CBD59B|nr:glycosyltransferase [Risungbinella massiliensis]